MQRFIVAMENKRQDNKTTSYNEGFDRRKRMKGIETRIQEIRHINNVWFFR